MGQSLQKSASIKTVDPNKEPLRVIDQVTFHNGSTDAVDITFCTATPMVSEDSNFSYEAVVSARLRIDVRLAKAIVDGLSRQIALIDEAQTAHGKAAAPAIVRMVN